MAKMTVQQVQALTAKDAPYKKAVDTGLLIRVAPSGLKTWIVQYVIDGKQRDFPLAKPWGINTDDAHISLRDARNESQKIRSLARQGIDFRVKLDEDRRNEADRAQQEQAATLLQAEQERIENHTLSDLFTVWIADGVARKDGNAELVRSFKKDVLPEIGTRRIKDINEHDIRQVLRKMVHRGACRLAVVTFRNLTQMFVWAEKRQPWRKLLVEGNPTQLVEIQKVVGPNYDLKNQRARILTDGEIKQLDLIFKSAQMQYKLSDTKLTEQRPVLRTTELAIWIMLGTLCRVGELLTARWENVDLNKHEWTIPRQDVKGNTQEFMIFLSSFAHAMFAKLKLETGHSQWCFPGVNDDHVSEKSISKQVGDRQAALKIGKDGKSRAPMSKRTKYSDALILSNGKNGNWTPHDLRRTGATIMQRVGIPEDIIDRCQNHVAPGPKVRRHYLLYKYEVEKRNAWDCLGQYLEKIVK